MIGSIPCGCIECITAYYTIVPLTPKKRSFPKSHDPNGLIDKNPGRNAT